MRYPILIATAALALSVGCKGGEFLGPDAPGPPGEPTTGSLYVLVSTPGAAPASVSVSGPAGFFRTLTESQAFLGVAPGVYRVVALPISVSGTSYAAMPEIQTATVLAGTDTTVLAYYCEADCPWVAKRPMPDALQLYGGGAMNGIIYALGRTEYGSLFSIQSYDPASELWSSGSNAPIACDGCAVGVAGGLVYVVGGRAVRGYSNVVAAFDPAAGTWSAKAPMPTARADLAVRALGGMLFAIGGTGDGGALSLVEAYDPATNSWSTRAPMPTARVGVQLGELNGVLYAVGGSGANGPVPTVEAYDAGTDHWSVRAPMPVARPGVSIGALNGRLFAAGDTSARAVLGAVDSYDPVSDHWTAIRAMPSELAHPMVEAVGGTMYVIGGLDRLGHPKRRIVALTP